MVDSTPWLGAVVDECSAGAAELVVEGDGCGEAEEALEDAFSEASQRSCAVAFEGEQVFAGPEDRFDALADWGEVGAVAGLVFAVRSDDRGVELADGQSEGPAGVALVAEQRLASLASAALEHRQSDLALIDLGGGELQRAGGAIRREDCVQPKAPEKPGVRGAPPVIGGVCERRALDRLAALRAPQRRGVDEQQIVIEPRALAGEHLQQPLECFRESPTTLEIARLGGQFSKQMAQTLGGDRQEAPVRRNSHDRLGDAQRDDLRVCDPTPRVPWLLRQEIVRRAINDGAESVEVGVHRGLLVDGVLDTADFGLSAKNPSNTAPTVDSLI